MKPYNITCPLYHVSFENLDGITMKPRIPDSRLDDEDDKHKRVCFSTSIAGALRAIGYGLNWRKHDGELYVMEPVDYTKIDVWKINEKDVPDVKSTREKWILNKVKVKCIGKIKVYSVYPKVRFRWMKNI